MLKELNLKCQLASFFGLSPEKISQVVSARYRRYKVYLKPKRSGGNRKILHPCQELKAFQYAVNELLLSNFNAHPIACAYILGKKSPLRNSAEVHATCKYTIRIDFKDFFPSIKFDALKAVVEKKYELFPSDDRLLEQILFYQDRQGFPYLPIGAPTSPIISNIVMIELDQKLVNLSKEIDQDSKISRYADDLYFSTNTSGKCKEFHKKVHALLQETTVPNLTINEYKTLYLSKGTKRVVNGLFVTPDKKISIGRERKTKMKSMIYKHSVGKLPNDEIKKAQGLLAFIQDCEPNFYNRLAQKYGDAFYALKKAKF